MAVDDERTPAGAGTPSPSSPSAASPSTAAPLARHHRRRVWTVVVASQVVLAMVTALVVVLAYRSLDGNIAEGEAINHLVEPPEPVVEEEGEEADLQPMNVLVMGSDSRAGEGNSIDGESGGGGSDTTILLHVSADRQEAYGVSLPRDALVTRPDCKTPDGTVPGGELQMFNTAFALGGPLCTVQMVEALTGIYVDHYLVLDFNGFKDMVEAVKGVEVCIPEDVVDPEHNIYFDAGVQTLTSDQALNYVRERTVLSSTGDIGRMKRQQAFIASMVNKVVSAGTLSRPTRVFDFLDAATSSIVVDENLDSIGRLVDLSMQFRDTGLTDISFITVPIAAYEPDPNRLVWTDQADQLWKLIRTDRPLGGTLAEGSLTAADDVGTPSGTPSGSPSTAGGGQDAPGTRVPEADPAQSEEQRAARVAAGLCA
ncbi:LCP family protein [Nocardioides sp. AX2bis]|uniref:LCP family protein n=1 Tax=Nocardioides sp. AX2bis TaxID=2653157 RepID=UPI0012F20082|nr:LCP family protein [Nocardioides sp. AX2bis]VXB81063.1 Transcriptional attenuator, LytR family [Nocardioides sp. AX2bis]